MSELAKKAASMVNLLPAEEQKLAVMLIERMLLAWDPDYTRLTDDETAQLQGAIAEMKAGDFAAHEAIDWN